MDQGKLSGLKFYSLGIVLEDKPRNQDMIEVDPIEDFVLDDGKILKDDRKYDVTLPDHKDRTKNSKIKGGSMLKAKWLPFGHSNRDTSPDVYKNETVMIFRFADEQEYYWTTLMREPEIRRLECVRYSYSNQPKGLEAYGDDTSYWIEYSTMDKKIHLHTSENNGEACTYDVTIDTQLGRINVHDNLGNSIELRSPEGELEITTTEKIILNTKKFIVNAEDYIEFNTRQFDVEAEESISLDTKKFWHRAAEYYYVETPLTSFYCPNTFFLDYVGIGGHLDVQKSIQTPYTNTLAAMAEIAGELGGVGPVETGVDVPKIGEPPLEEN